MKSKRVINSKSPCIRTQVPDNEAKNLLAFVHYDSKSISHLCSK